MEKISNNFRATALLTVIPLFLHAQKITNLKINPTSWYISMENPNTQLLVYGEKVRKDRIELKKNEGVNITRVSTVGNLSYAFIDLVISPDAKARDLHFVVNHDSKITNFDYELANKTAKPQAVTPTGFIYLPVPNRFSNGDSTNDKFTDMADQTHDQNNLWKRHNRGLLCVTAHR
jgi:hypothetical protein